MLSLLFNASMTPFMAVPSETYAKLPVWFKILLNSAASTTDYYDYHDNSPWNVVPPYDYDEVDYEPEDEINYVFLGEAHIIETPKIFKKINRQLMRLTR